MNKALNHISVDMVLNLFYGRLPYGVNFFSLTSRCNFPEEERQIIFDFLIHEKLIQKFDDDFKYIITQKGIEVLTKHCGTKNFIESLKNPNS